jgi:hypothetical protein
MKNNNQSRNHLQNTEKCKYGLPEIPGVGPASHPGDVYEG